MSYKEFNKSIGLRIRNVRKSQDLTQTDLAIRLGKSLRTIQKYESGEIEMTASQIKEISKVLGCSYGFLVGFEELSIEEITADAIGKITQTCKHRSSSEGMSEANADDKKNIPKDEIFQDDLISRKEVLAEIDAMRKLLIDSKMPGAEHILVHYGRRVVEDARSVCTANNCSICNLRK